MRSLLPFLLLYLFQPHVLKAQSQPPDKSEFGDIPSSLFEMPQEHSYPFEYLLIESEVRFSEFRGTITAILDHLVRIRVYSDDPVEMTDAALVSIPFYHLDDLEQVTMIEGITHHPGGGRTRLDPDEVRTTDFSTRYKMREFLMPDVQQGSILEYRYQVRRRYIEELPDVYISHQVPARKVHFTLHNTDYMRFEAIPENVNVELTYVEERIDTSSIPLAFTYQRPEPVLKQHWFASDIPAVDAESYISSLDDLRGKLKFQISEFGRPRQPLENSWEFVAAQIRRGEHNPFELADQLAELLHIGERVAEELGSGEAARDSLFQLVNSRMAFNEMHGIFSDPQPGQVLEGVPFDQPSINMVLLTLLQGAGIDAYPLYLSGRRAGRINMEFPSLYQFNQMLVYAESASGGVLMDASFPHSRPGLISIDSYNREGMLLKPNAIEWMEIRPEFSLFDLDLDFEASLSEEGLLTGRMTVETGGYPAQQIREELSTGRPAASIVKDSFFDAYGEMELHMAEIRESEEGGYPLRIEAEFEIPRYAISFREGLQFRPMVVGYLQRNPFEESTRNAPVTLDAPERLNLRYRISLPEEFTIEDMEQNSTTRTRGAVLNEEYEVRSGVIRYRFDVEIERREFSMEEYGDLKNLYDRWVFLSHDEWFIAVD